MSADSSSPSQPTSRDVGHLLAVGDDPYVELPVEAHNGDVQAHAVGDDRDG
jgi:hypothetical protein